MVKKNQIFGISLIIGLIIIVSFLYYQPVISPDLSSQGQQAYLVSDSVNGNVLGKVSNNVVLDTSMPKSSERILTYKVVPHHYTRQDILALAQKFNISPIGRIKEVEEGASIASEDGMAYAILRNSGSTEYTNSKRAGTVNPLDVPGKPPSDEDAEKITTTFLKDRGLLPEGAVYIGTEHGRIYQLGENGNDTVVWEDIEVWYGRMLNGLKVKGSQLSVAVGGNGDIIDYYSNWRDYEPYQVLPIKPPEQAFENLKVKGVPVGMNKQESVSINDMYLAYYTKAGAETEEYLEPVWVFKGNVMVDGKPVMPVEQYIPALTEESIKSLSST